MYNLIIMKYALPSWVILFLLFLQCLKSYTQDRGVMQVQVSIDDTITTLYQQSHALLIGVSNYTNGLRSLPGVAGDIQEIKSLLEKNGFSTQVVMNPDHIDLTNTYNDFIARFGQFENSRLLFYFAGHGYTKKIHGNDIGYLLPSDCPNPEVNLGGFQTCAMPMGIIELFAQQIQSKHALFLFDACFSGAVFTQSRGIPGIITYKTTLPVRQFITSGSAEETVPDISIFRQQLIKAIEGEADLNKDGYITGTELGEFLQNAVVEYSKNSQHPQYGKIRDSNLDKGDFVFVLKSSNSITAALPNTDIKKEQAIVHTGKLEITSQVPGYIYLDGKYIKYLNEDIVLPLNDLTEGPHTIKFSGNETEEKTIDILPGKTVNLTFETKKKRAIVSDNFDMIFVEGGTFFMGSDKGGRIESPVHPVTLDGFYIGQYEVTQTQWQDVMGYNPSQFNDCFNCPVENVSWDNVQEFLAKLNKKTGKNYRLPTEAEWEFAAIGGSAGKGYEYSGSNDPDEVAWYVSTSNDKTHPVGQKKTNELGIYDMSGNVWEWCNDYFEKDYYSVSHSKNPKGPSKTSNRVLRGGSRDCAQFQIRTRNRGRTFSFDKGSYYGFRICLSE
jgi:formylglycine-generating enzyme required for sulfatase activity